MYKLGLKHDKIMYKHNMESDMIQNSYILLNQMIINNKINSIKSQKISNDQRPVWLNSINASSI